MDYAGDTLLRPWHLPVTSSLDAVRNTVGASWNNSCGKMSRKRQGILTFPMVWYIQYSTAQVPVSKAHVSAPLRLLQRAVAKVVQESCFSHKLVK